MPRHALPLLVLAATSLAAQLPPVPDVVYTPHTVWFGPYAETTRVNLLAEGASFEVGADDALDGGFTYLERRFYTRWLDRGQGNLYLTTFEPPRVVALAGGTTGTTHGLRCLKLTMRNRSAPQLFGRFFLAPATGRYTVSLAVRGDPSVTSRPPLSVHIRDMTGRVVGNRGIAPGPAWQRVSFTTTTLQAGAPYYLWLGFGTWDPSRNYPDQSVWIDAIRIAPPGAASPTTYAHPTRYVSLALRTALQVGNTLSPRRPFDIFWAGEDDGRRRLALDVYEETPIQGTLPVRVYLYDSRGVPTNPATARAATTLRVASHATGHQTLAVDLEPLLQAAGNDLGFYMVVCEAKDSNGRWVDRAAASFAVLRRAPPTIPDPDASPFGGHLLVFRSPYQDARPDFWHLYGVSANASVADHFRLMRDVGCRWNRSFQLFSYEASRYYTQGAPKPANLAWPPPASLPGVCREFAQTAAQYGIRLLGVFYGDKGRGPYDTYYRNYVREMAAGYSALGVRHGEVLNEPNHGQRYIQPATYAAWVYSTRREADAAVQGFKIVGPVTTWADINYITSVFNTRIANRYTYEYLDVISYHRYLKGDDTFPWNWLPAAQKSDMRRGPEDAYKGSRNGFPNCSEWEMRVMAGEKLSIPQYSTPLQKPAGLGGGPVDKPIWISEWAGRYPEVQADNPRIEANLKLVGGFSGSLTLARRAAARMVRYHVVALQRGTQRVFHWDTFFSRWRLTPWRLIGADKSATPVLAAYSHMTNRLEGFAFVDAVTPTELPTNGVNLYYTRCAVFAERTAANPRRPQAVAVLWNWAADEFDHRQGSPVQDPYDPPPVQQPTLIPQLNLNPADVEVTDQEGRVLRFSGTRITSLRLTEEPVYIKTKPTISLQELMLALDTIRPLPPSRVGVQYHAATGRVRVTAPLAIPAPDVRAFGTYREDHGPGTWRKIGEFTPKQGYYDDYPGPGIWRYRLTAIEQFTEYETSPSPPSALVQLPPPAPPRLTANPQTLSGRLGGSAFLTYEAGGAYRNRDYVMAASLSGYYPGVPLGGSLHLHLNPDGFTVMSLLMANQPPFLHFQGRLDGTGKATAEFRVPRRLNLPGPVEVTFTAVTWNPLDVAANAVVVTVTG